MPIAKMIKGSQVAQLDTKRFISNTAEVKSTLQ